MLYPLELDVCDGTAVHKTRDSILSRFGHIDLLVNNAGLALGMDKAQEVSFDDWQSMIETNITGLARVTHAFLPSMIERSHGHIINLGSVAGTYPYPGGSVYGATKAFVAQFSLNLRADVAGTGIRVTDLQPGLCGGTEFSVVRFKGDEKRAAAMYQGVDPLMPEDIAETVSWVAGLPSHCNVNSMEIMPTAQSFSALHISRRAT